MCIHYAKSQQLKYLLPIEYDCNTVRQSFTTMTGVSKYIFIFGGIKMEYEKMLGVEAPKSWTHVVREVPTVTQEQRKRALEMTHYNEFAFPAGLLYIDCLSDSGTTSMTDTQWSTMFLADESYGRNKGYYVLLDAFRDVWERGDDQKRLINYI